MSSFDPVPTTIVVFCSDPRFQLQFRNLIVGELALGYGQFVPITVLGGGTVLAESLVCTDERICVGQNIEATIEEFRTIKTVVLVGHEDCKRAKLPNDEAKNRLLEAGETVRRLFPDVEVRLYFTSFDGKSILLPEQQLAW